MCQGGEGADRFVFSSQFPVVNSETFVDTIVDFDPSEDTIVLVRSSFTALPEGKLPVAAFAVSGLAQDNDGRIIYNVVSGRLRYDPDGAKSGFGPIEFAKFPLGVAITAADFVFV